jgi:hypothetical protein
MRLLVDFFLLVLVNAALFIRPSEIIPDLAAVPIYNILISSCLLVSLPAWTNELTHRRRVETPITVCVLGMLAALMMSHLSHYNLTYTKDAGLDFLKFVAYYLLLVGVLNSTGRLDRFLVCLGGLIGMVTVLSLLHYNGIVTIASMHVGERWDVNSATGEVYRVSQLYGTGIFSDPNDLSLIMMVGIAISLYKFEARSSAARWLWFVPLVAFGYTLALTQSRGGFIAMLASVLSIFVGRFGWRKAIPLAAVILPLILLLFGGRQTNLETSSGTGQQRIQLWALSFAVIRRMPLFGLGAGLLPDEIGKDAHNSFVQSYAELGFFGGTFFVGMYACAFWGLRQVGRHSEQIRDPALRRMRPYLLGIVTGWTFGMFSLTRHMVIVTYTFPGLVAAYLRLVAADTPTPLPLPRSDARLAKRLIATSAGVLLFHYIYVRMFARFG